MEIFLKEINTLLQKKRYDDVLKLIINHFPVEDVEVNLDISESIYFSLTKIYNLLQEHKIYDTQYLLTSGKQILKSIDYKLSMQAKSIKRYLWEIKPSINEEYKNWIPDNEEDYFQTLPHKVFGEFYIFPKYLNFEGIITKFKDDNIIEPINKLIISNKRNIAQYESLTKYSMPLVKEWFLYLKEDIEEVNRFLLSRRGNKSATIITEEVKKTVKVSIPATQYALILFLLLEKFGVNIIKTGKKKEFNSYFIHRIVNNENTALPFDLDDANRFQVEDKINQLSNTYKPEKAIKSDTLLRYMKKDMLFNLKIKAADNSNIINETLLEEVNTIWKNKLGYSEEFSFDSISALTN